MVGSRGGGGVRGRWGQGSRGIGVVGSRVVGVRWWGSGVGYRSFGGLGVVRVRGW